MKKKLIIAAAIIIIVAAGLKFTVFKSNNETELGYAKEARCPGKSWIFLLILIPKLNPTR